jgi:hypothetical protein
MPGLLRGVARTAVVAGTATAVSNRVSRRQATRWNQQAGAEQYAAAPQGYAEPPAPPPQAATEEDPIAKLQQLGQLHSSGVLTDEEFAAAKAKILNG